MRAARFFAFALAAFLELSNGFFGGIVAPRNKSEENAPRSGRRDNRQIRRDVPQRIPFAVRGLVQIPPSAVKINAAMWAFPWPMA